MLATAHMMTGPNLQQGKSSLSLKNTIFDDVQTLVSIVRVRQRQQLLLLKNRHDMGSDSILLFNGGTSPNSCILSLWWEVISSFKLSCHGAPNDSLEFDCIQTLFGCIFIAKTLAASKHVQRDQTDQYFGPFVTHYGGFKNVYLQQVQFVLPTFFSC